LKSDFRNILRNNELIQAQNEAILLRNQLREIGDPKIEYEKSLISEKTAFEKSMDKFQTKPDDYFLFRRKTAGIATQHFELKQKKFELMDAGSQRSERKRWNSSLKYFSDTSFEFD
jgi:hypothetical protein